MEWFSGQRALGLISPCLRLGIYLLLKIRIVFSHPGVHALFTGDYSLPAVSVYHPSARMKARAVGISGFRRDRWFLASLQSPIQFVCLGLFDSTHIPQLLFNWGSDGLDWLASLASLLSVSCFFLSL